MEWPLGLVARFFQDERLKPGLDKFAYLQTEKAEKNMK